MLLHERKIYDNSSEQSHFFNILENHIMANKEQKNSNNKKKPAAKSLKEKRAAKKEKKGK